MERAPAAGVDATAEKTCCSFDPPRSASVLVPESGQPAPAIDFPGPVNPSRRPARLQEGWVIANHILVSFHVAFISSVLALPSVSILKGEVLQFIFVSPETLVSAAFMYISFHAGIAFHELGHFVAAARLNALNDNVLKRVKPELEKPLLGRLRFYLGLFLRAPYGKALGIKREGLNYYPDAPYNLAVAAAGPRASRNVALAALPPAVILLALGLVFGAEAAIYAGRLLLGIGVVTLLDFLLADPGKYAEFRDRERKAREQAEAVAGTSGWAGRVAAVKKRMLAGRIQEVTHPRLGPVTAPWQFRNCGMGGRHTEKEYPESNISMQEAMFLILGARDYQEAQEMTVRLQTRLKEIIEKEEGCRVMGIGLEGGLAPYVERGDYPLPEVRLWAMMRQAIEECGFRPGEEVAIALDPALSELEIAYREEFNMPDAVGMYLFWRDKAKKVLDRDGVLEIYLRAINEFEIPIVSIEDGFSENDFEGWQKLLEALGDRIFVIGDDLVTTNDQTIETAASGGLINAALIKANQIGSLYETLLAMLVALGKGQEIVVSHRSKSPNDDMEAHIALAVNALGLKCGGGANTERLIKYQAVAELMGKGGSDSAAHALGEGRPAVVHRIVAYEEPTNAGIPTVGATVELALPDAGVLLRFRGATPLGTSAGSGEAIHLVDSLIEAAEHREVISRHESLFRETEPGVFAFKKDVREARIREAGDEALEALFARTRRYGGKGCLSAVENVFEVVAPALTGRNASLMTLEEIDRALLGLEVRAARRRGKIAVDAAAEERIQVMQRKQNLGMNALLSVSLALARGVAHLRGKELYELLREEMIRIVSRFAEQVGVAIAGSRFEDYVAALREANEKLEGRGEALYEALRALTGIYRDEGEVEARKAPRTSKAPPVEAPAPAPAAPETPEPATASEDRPAPAAPPAATPLEEFTEVEQEAIASLDRAFYRAFESSRTEADRLEALRRYRTTKQDVTRRAGRFGLVNNRLYRHDGRLVVPYLLGDTIVLRGVREAAVDVIAVRRFPPGTLFTDALIDELVGVPGAPIDLEGELFEFHADPEDRVRITRIRDMAAALERINESTNRNEAVFALRGLAARLQSLSFKAFLGAKNMQPEVRKLHAELDRFLNGPHARRLPLLVRVLVRNIAGLAAKPSLIDRLWNDTIDLAEVHVRGSDIVNEIRRSTHHALGKPTQRLARAYLDYLERGDAEGLAAAGYPGPSAADETARGREKPLVIVRRIVNDLEKFLGTTDIAERVRDWQEAYAEALEQCEFGKSVDDEVEEVVANGIRERNRWVYYHHLRILKKKVDDLARHAAVGEEANRALEVLLELKPDDPGFDVEEVERTVRERIGSAFLSEIRAEHQDGLFQDLDAMLEAYEQNEFFEAFNRMRKVRQDLAAARARGGFAEQRHHLYQLDCLLEEMGHLAVRHLASRYEAEGVPIARCLEIIRTAILNLEYDGLRSRELKDLSALLVDGSRTFNEVLNLLDSIQRIYHKILQRVTAPYEVMRERLGLGEDELRQLLGTMQRQMYDLNTMVYFTELVGSHVLDPNIVADRTARVGEAAGPADRADPEVIHISDREAIRPVVEDGQTSLNLRGRFGGKGASLLYISYLGLPTRDGFILPATWPRSGRHERERAEVEREIVEHLRILEADIARRDGAERRFGDQERPLLVAVRGGSVFSMPGILSTVVFLGMNDRVAARLAEDDPWQAYDAYRRFLASFSQAQFGLNLEGYDLVEATKRRYGVATKEDLPWEGMKEVVDLSKAAIRQKGFGEALDAALADPEKQLVAAVYSVFDSWNRETARRYRAIKGICDTWHTAAVVQEMAFGNRTNETVGPGMDETRASLTGVIPHTRMTEGGFRVLEGEFKFSAAGDDLVAGVTTSGSFRPLEELETVMPMLARRLKHVVARLRRFYGTDQEMEFTVDRGVLSVLQSRTAEKSVDLEIDAFHEPGEAATRGLGVRGGAFRGLVAFDDADRIELMGQDLSEREDVDGVLMVIENPVPEDIPVILSADGLLTAKGGSSSHAAVAINGLETKSLHAVMSARGLKVDTKQGEAVIQNPDGKARHRFRRGDIVSIDGAAGDVFIGTRPLKDRVKGPFPAMESTV